MKTIRQTAFRGRIGISRFDITPPAGIYSRMWGAAEHDTAEGIHRPLTGTALCVADADGESQLVLVTLDLGWWRTVEEEWYIRGYVLERLGLESAQLIITLTHTHAGPSISRVHRDRPGGALIEPYLEKLREAIVGAIDTARKSSRAASLVWATGRCGLACNRHFRAPGGGLEVVGYNPGGPADDTLLVGRVAAPSGETLATIVNYACHPTTLGPANRLISPDFVGAMRELVEERTGGAPCLFLQGASGELAPQQQYTGDTAIADRNGRVLGYAALSTLEAMLPAGFDYRFSGVIESGASLGMWSYEPSQPSQQLGSAELSIDLPLKRALPEMVAPDLEFEHRVLAERLERARHLNQLIGNSSRLSMPAWAWRLGDSFLVGIPAECHSYLQTKLRASNPGKPFAVVNIANGYFGYVPAKSHYDGENYEAHVSLLAAGSLEALTEEVAHALNGSSSTNGMPAPHFLPAKGAPVSTRV